MKIAYVTTYDSNDIHAWSGLGTFIRQALEFDGHEVRPVGPVDKGARPLWLRGFRQFEKLRGKVYLPERNAIVAMMFAREAARALPDDTELIVSPGVIPISRLRTPIPKMVYTDATFGGILGYYEQYRNLSPISRREGMALESSALRDCQACVFASDWAAQTAIRLHGASPERVHVVPFGANLSFEPELPAVREAVQARSRVICNILFWGVEWERKRGGFALEVVEKLRATGIDARLHVIGIRGIPVDPLPEYVLDHGFLSKADPEQNRRLLDLLRTMHFLLLPTRAEAFGLVFAEASAYGIPSLAPRTGGIPTAVHEGRNGILFETDAEPEAYAEAVRTHFLDFDRYREFALSAFEEYRSRLNWRTSGASLGAIARSLVGQPS